MITKVTKISSPLVFSFIEKLNISENDQPISDIKSFGALNVLDIKSFGALNVLDIKSFGALNVLDIKSFGALNVSDMKSFGALNVSSLGISWVHITEVVSC